MGIASYSVDLVQSDFCDWQVDVVTADGDDRNLRCC